MPSQKFFGVPDPGRSRARPLNVSAKGGAAALVAPAGGAGMGHLL